MRLLLIRHAIAVEPGTPGYADDERPLTDRGRRRFRTAARGLARLLPAPDRILTSPLRRAVETAKMAARAWDAPAAKPYTPLAGGSPEAVLGGLGKLDRDACVALVGHEPHLSLLLAHLLGGADHQGVGFRKGGAALVELAAARPTASRLIWFLPPGVLRRIGRS